MKALLFVILFVYFTATSYASNYYFSASSGNDSRSASEAQNPSTPWKTLSKLNSFFSSLRPGDKVYLKRGDNFYGSIIVKQSGSASAPIIIGAYGTGNKPVITSLVTLTDWVSKGGNIWESTNALLGSRVNIVLLNGAIQEMGRYPNSNAANKGYLTFDSHYGKTSITDNELNTSVNWTGAELVLRPRHWILDRALITAQSSKKLTYKGSGVYEPYASYGYFIQNSIRTLDRTGEWYHNPSAKKLSIYSSSKPSSVQASTTTNNLVSSSGYSNITFDNLSIKGSNASAFFIQNGSNIHVQNCDILFTGITGALVHGHSGLHIENCTIANTNNNAIDMEYSVTKAVIKNNKILNSGVIPGLIQNGEGTGLAIYSNGEGATIEGNEIKEAGFIGITFYGSNVTIKNNLIDHFCFVKDDGGALYSHGGATASTNRKLLNNIILNGTGAGPGTDRPTKVSVNGIYMDADVVNIEITGNTVANCHHGLFLQSTQGTVVKGNTFYDNTYQMSILRRAERHIPKNNNLTQNVCFSKTKDQQSLYASTSANDISSFGTFDYNFYARPVDDKLNIFTSHISGGKMINNDIDLATWQSKYGKDMHSKKSPMTISNTLTAINSSIVFQYNASGSSKSISLNGATYMDVTGRKYSGSISLLPYTSIVLMKTSGSGSINTPPTVNITSPSNNSSFSAGASINLTASASDAGGSISKVEFFNGSTLLGSDNSSPYSFSWAKVAEGDYSITALATDNGGATTFSNPVSITVGSGGTGGGSTAPVVTMTAPGNVTYKAPATITMSATASDNDGSVQKVQFFNGNTLLKTESTAPYNFTWSNVPVGTYVLTARATDNDGLTTTSASNVVTVSSTGTQSGAPVVTLTSPGNAAFSAGADITITATATDANGSIAKVEFFNGAALLNTQQGAPYSYVWNNVSAGTYTITARATDNSGLTTTSTANVVNVGTTGSTNGAPVVSLTSPVANATYSSSSTVTITASASDANGSIDKVEFYNGSTLLNTQKTAPYNYAWQNVQAGKYTITAKATDNAGNVTTTAGVPISVGSQSAARGSSSATTSGNQVSNPTGAVAVEAQKSGKLSLQGEPANSPNFRLLANPVVNNMQVYIEGLQTNQKASVTIYNAQGSIVKRYPVVVSGNKMDVNVSSLSAGIYIIGLSGDNFSINKKFSKVNY